MKVGIFLDNIKQWLDEHNENEVNTFKVDTPEYDFIMNFESRNLVGSEIKINGKSSKDFQLINKITSEMDDRLSVIIVTTFDKNGNLIKVMNYVGCLNLYNGFIKHANNHLRSIYGDRAKIRPYYSKESKSDYVTKAKKLANKLESVRLNNAINQFELGQIDKAKLDSILKKVESKSK
jgi:5S rRNA maturation endonuclease (ribonuclease M5)